jgi:hypothetical protein
MLQTLQIYTNEMFTHGIYTVQAISTHLAAYPWVCLSQSDHGRLAGSISIKLSNVKLAQMTFY